MEADGPSALQFFGEDHFGASELGDRRLTQRVVYTANRFMQHPGGTLPDKLNDNASLIGMYRMANNSKVTHEKIMASHFALTRSAMKEVNGVVLIIHDTTEADFSGLDSVKGLGPIGNGGCRGFLAHNSLAYDFDAANQTLHIRRKVPKNETPKQKREHPQRESRLWKTGWLAVGPAPEGKLWVNVCDRGADLYEFIEGVDKGDEFYCIRSKSNRLIELAAGFDGESLVTISGVGDDAGKQTPAKLHDLARQLPTLGTREIQVRANYLQKPRKATVRVASAPVIIRAPEHARGEHSRESQTAWVVHVLEINPPKGCEAIEWVLLTNVPTEGLEATLTRIDWYACRPVVEEYHKAIKTGCSAEEQQFTTLKALQVTWGILCVVAVQLLCLRDLSRREDAKIRPAKSVIDECHVDLMCQWRFRKLLPEISVHDFFRALAKLGGHLNRTHDGDPGWLVLWRGWTKLQLMVEGAQAAQRRRCV
jgi:Transposase DNA-binding